MKPILTLVIALFLSGVNGKRDIDVNRMDSQEIESSENSHEKGISSPEGQVNRDKLDDPQTGVAPVLGRRYQKPKQQTYNTKQIIQGLNKHGLDSGLNLNVQIVCNERGYFKDPVNPDCNTFLMCDITATGDLFAYTLTCPKGWLYNPKQGFCSPFYKCK